MVRQLQTNFHISELFKISGANSIKITGILMSDMTANIMQTIFWILTNVSLASPT